MTRFLAIAFLALIAASCTSGEETREARNLWFVDGYVSELGMRGKLSQVERDRAGNDSPARALGELLKGPTAAERETGLISALPARARVQSFSLADGTATARLQGRIASAGDLYATAQVVYTLTEFDEVRRVRLFVNGRRCCLYQQNGRPVAEPLQRRHFRGWQGDPLPPPGSG